MAGSFVVGMWAPCAELVPLVAPDSGRPALSVAVLDSTQDVANLPPNCIGCAHGGIPVGSGAMGRIDARWGSGRTVRPVGCACVAVACRRW